jgi:transposase
MWVREVSITRYSLPERGTTAWHASHLGAPGDGRRDRAGLRHPSVAAWVGRSSPTVRFWLRRYRCGGLAALADAPRSGRPPRADAVYLAAMEKAVECSPRAVGLAVDVWTSHRLSSYLAATTGVRLSAGRLRWHLRRRGFACGRARHTLTHLQDADSRAFADGILDGLRRLGGERVEVVDRVPDWFLAGHRHAPTGKPTGRPLGRRDRPRALGVGGDTRRRLANPVCGFPVRRRDGRAAGAAPTTSIVSTSLSAKTGAGPRRRSRPPPRSAAKPSSTAQNTATMNASRSTGSPPRRCQQSHWCAPRGLGFP